MASGQCARFNDDLSSYVDETLSQRRYEQISYHLAGCPECLAEVKAIAVVRSKLSSCKQSCAPTALMAKLESIAGEEATLPLYMAAGKAEDLVPKRGYRIAMQSGAALLVTAMAVAVLAVLVAPEPVRVSDPLASAKQQFAQASTAISASEPVSAVLLASQQGANFDETVDLNPRVTVGKSVEVSADVVEKTLASRSYKELSFTGKQKVYLSAGEGKYLVADTSVTQVAGQGTQIEVRDALGRIFSSSATELLAQDLDLVPPADWTFKKYRIHDHIAGRDATQLVAFDGDLMVASWWVDLASGLVLWKERYNSAGQVSVAAGFSEISFGAVELTSAESAAVSSAIALYEPASASQQSGWCIAFTRCPLIVGKLPLVAFSHSPQDDDVSMTLVYSNGFDTAVVTATQGVLSEQTTLRADAAVGLPSISVWQCGNLVVTLASTAAVDTNAEILQDLPSPAKYEQTALDRVVAGLSRMTGIS